MNKGVFKKLTRYTIRCAICGKLTDTMSENEDQAKYYFLQKGWLNYAVKGEDGKPASVTVCKKPSLKKLPFSYLKPLFPFKLDLK